MHGYLHEPRLLEKGAAAEKEIGKLWTMDLISWENPDSHQTQRPSESKPEGTLICVTTLEARPSEDDRHNPSVAPRRARLVPSLSFSRSHTLGPIERLSYPHGGLRLVDEGFLGRENRRGVIIIIYFRRRLDG